MLVSYSKAYELKQKQWQEKTNFTTWLGGAYIQNAVTSVLSKNHLYPGKPFELYENKDNSDSVKSSEDAIKKRSKDINEMINKR